MISRIIRKLVPLVAHLAVTLMSGACLSYPLWGQTNTWSTGSPIYYTGGSVGIGTSLRVPVPESSESGPCRGRTVVQEIP